MAHRDATAGPRARRAAPRLLEPGSPRSRARPSALHHRAPRAAAAIVVDPVDSALAGGLRYVTDGRDDGIRRIRAGRAFRYCDGRGRPVRHRATLRRIRALAIPPAWTDVWICPSADGHVQATGRDARRRKQYRYHARWRAVRDEVKFRRMIAFATALPRIRVRVDTDLARDGLSRERVLATVVRLLERTCARVGNAEYARTNHSYGLTTLRTQHARVARSRVHLAFRAKGGKRVAIDVADRRLARVVARCRELPGQELFQYVDDAGVAQAIGSADVNAYLREISGHEFTAKDFRTWAGTVLAAVALAELGPAARRTEANRHVVRAIQTAAERLGNTAAVCRKSYVHPAIVDAYVAGETIRVAPHALRGLSPEEAAVLALLRHRLTTRTRAAS